VKRPIRRFAVWLIQRTNHWVVSHDLWTSVVERHPDAKQGLEQQERLWPFDPEVLHAQAAYRLELWKAKNKK